MEGEAVAPICDARGSTPVRGCGRAAALAAVRLTARCGMPEIPGDLRVPLRAAPADGSRESLDEGVAGVGGTFPPDEILPTPLFDIYFLQNAGRWISGEYCVADQLRGQRTGRAAQESESTAIATKLRRAGEDGDAAR
jgi:hypothetical protein